MSRRRRFHRTRWRRARDHARREAARHAAGPYRLFRVRTAGEFLAAIAAATLPGDIIRLEG